MYVSRRIQDIIQSTDEPMMFQSCENSPVIDKRSINCDTSATKTTKNSRLMTTEEQTSEDMLLLENDPDFCRKEVDDNLWADPQMLALLSTEYQKFNDQAKLNIGNKSLFRL